METDQVLDHIERLLEQGLPWDAHQYYRTLGDIEIYGEVSEGKLVNLTKLNVGEAVKTIGLKGSLEIEIISNKNK